MLIIYRFVYSGGHAVPWKEWAVSCSMIKIKKKNNQKHNTTHLKPQQPSPGDKHMLQHAHDLLLLVGHHQLSLDTWVESGSQSVNSNQTKFSLMVFVIFDARLVTRSLLTTDIVLLACESLCVFFFFLISGFLFVYCFFLLLLYGLVTHIRMHMRTHTQTRARTHTHMYTQEK